MSIFFLIVAIVFLFIGLRNKQTADSKVGIWPNVRGQIVENRTHRNWGGKQIFTPLVLFYTIQGQQCYFNGVGSQWPHYNAGQQVEVAYNPQSPAEAIIRGDSANKFFRTIMFLVVGLALLGGFLAFIGDILILSQIFS